jgi:hypothetical protein
LNVCSLVGEMEIDGDGPEHELGESGTRGVEPVGAPDDEPAGSAVIASGYGVQIQKSVRPAAFGKLKPPSRMIRP